MPTPSLAEHIRRTLALGLPLVGAQLAQILINTTDTVMLGWLSTEALAAGTLAMQLYFILFIVGIGFAAAMVPVIAAAIGEEEIAKERSGGTADLEETTREIRRAARMGLWVLILVSLLFMVPLWFADAILVALGQPPEVIALAVPYLAIAQWSLIPALLVIGLRQFLTALERAQVVLWITVATLLINGVLDYALIFGKLGAPRLGVEGAAWATLGSNALALVITAAWVQWRPDLAVYGVFERFWRPDWAAFRRILRLGWPIGLALLAEAGLFAVSTFMMGRLGTVPLAAHGIALQLASIAFMIPLGLSQAATVRVGNAAGRHDRTAVSRAALAAYVCGLGLAVAAGLLFLLLPEPLISLFLEDNVDAAQVIAVAVPLVVMAGLFQIADSSQVVGISVLRGLQDTTVPMVIALVGYWLIGVPAAWVLGLELGYGGPGVWSGLVIGLSLTALAFAWRFHRRERLGLLPSEIAAHK